VYRRRSRVGRAAGAGRSGLIDCRFAGQQKTQSGRSGLTRLVDWNATSHAAHRDHDCPVRPGDAAAWRPPFFVTLERLNSKHRSGSLAGTPWTAASGVDQQHVTNRPGGPDPHSRLASRDRPMASALLGAQLRSPALGLGRRARRQSRGSRGRSETAGGPAIDRRQRDRVLEVVGRVDLVDACVRVRPPNTATVSACSGSGLRRVAERWAVGPAAV
jgi:hypothetical protein